MKIMASDRPVESERAANTGARSGFITRVAWVTILALTAIFHFIRGAPADGAIFLIAALVLALDAFGWVRIAPFDRERHPRRLLFVVLIGVAAIVLGLAPLYGGVESVGVVAIGIALIPMVWPQPRIPTRRARPDAVRRAAIAWSTVAVLGCLWEIGAFFLSRTSPTGVWDFPPLSDLLDPLIASPVTRLALVVAWLAGGYALIRRGRSS